MNGWLKAAGAAVVTALATYAAFMVAERFRPALEAAADEAEHHARAGMAGWLAQRRLDRAVEREKARVLWEAWQITEQAAQGGPTQGAAE